MNKILSYVKAHADHFMISIGVSIVITVITDVIVHYATPILHWMHIPGF
ncbi:Uncharacterised protein [uncultured archaeon]|nr:Uncharacterised protein [uncultured archaeon]